MSNYKWQKANTTRISLKLFNTTDADILTHLSKQENKQGYIKRIIREDIARENKQK